MKPYIRQQSLVGPARPSSARALRVWTAPTLGVLLIAQAAVAAAPQSEAASERSDEIDPVLVERWEARYQHASLPSWDTGRPATELKRLVEQGVLGPCRVLELGCGTGVNTVYLAEQGFKAMAIVVAPTALELARERAKKAGVRSALGSGRRVGPIAPRFV